MNNILKNLVVGSLLLFGATACADLDVVNQNDADKARSLATPGDVLSLIGGGFYNWFYGNYNYNSAGMALSNAAFQHNAPWANAGMEKYGRLPRIAFVNSIADADYGYLTRSYFYSYRAIAAAADGMKSLEAPEVEEGLDADEINSAKAFGRFILAMGHATIATLFAEGFIVDETTVLLDESGFLISQGDPIPYNDMMDYALGQFDDVISQSSGASWTLDGGWMKAALTGPELARVASSMKARFRAAVARTPAERQAVDWDAVISEVNAGVTEDLLLFMDDDNGWNNDVLGYGAYYGWSQMNYFIYGMADQSGNFQAWDALPLADKSHTLPNGDPVLIVTPDLRFPQGSTVAEQRANTGMYFRINKAGSETGGTWARPDRGKWRWSWYKHTRGEEYWDELEYDQPEIRMEEMNLLKAEALYRNGDLAGAAAIINETRVAAGLNATDAAGTNTSCVPKLLPNATGGKDANGCGDLFEMLKWEKRMENTFKGPLGVLWFFDGRGWGDLWKDTLLHLPLPCAEAMVLQVLPCGTAGGPGGEFGSAGGLYGWNGEG